MEHKLKRSILLNLRNEIQGGLILILSKKKVGLWHHKAAAYMLSSLIVNVQYASIAL